MMVYFKLGSNMRKILFRATGDSWEHLNLVVWPKLRRVSCSSVVERPTGVEELGIFFSE